MSEDALTLTLLLVGTAFEATGVLVVIKQLVPVLRRYPRSAALRTRLQTAWRRLFRQEPTAADRSTSVARTLGPLSAGGNLHVAQVNPTVEDRLLLLEMRADSQTSALAELYSELDRAQAGLRRQAQEMRREGVRELEEVRRQIQGIELSEIAHAWLSLPFLIIGLIIANLSDEIASLFF